MSGSVTESGRSPRPATQEPEMKTLAKILTTALAGALALGASALGATPVSAAQASVTHPVVVNANPIDTTPHVLDGQAEAVLDLGTRVLVGGKFTQVKRYSKPEVFTRPNLFAYTKAKGEIDTTFAPALNGKVTRPAAGPRRQGLRLRPVQERGRRDRRVVPHQDRPGHRRRRPRLRPLDQRHGLRPAPANGRLYVGGTFTKVRNMVRTNFAVLDPTTGKANTDRRRLHRRRRGRHPGHALRRHPRRHQARRHRQLHQGRRPDPPERRRPRPDHGRRRRRQRLDHRPLPHWPAAARPTTPTSSTSTSRPTAAGS